ncbi:MAG: ATP-grasp domain-containing protein [Lentisphaerae bacterium]|nr:ATP-grasp domain-containing protein [Lentisphaerota bacterium]
MKKLRILVLFDSAGTPPGDQDYTEDFEKEDWFTEAAVCETLQAMGHEVRTLGIYDDIRLLINCLDENPTDVVFNLTEVFMGQARLDKNVPALLELLGVPYTGCSPDGMILCNNKALSKKILTYHRVRVPRFCTLRKGHRIRLPSKMRFPVVVKPLREEASTGISLSSFAQDEAAFVERVKFIQDSMGMHAIAEEYIDGREFYVSILGRRRLVAFPVREMRFDAVPENMPTMATYSAKWNEQYRKRWGISNGFPENLAPEIEKKMQATCKRAYRALSLDGYARFDCRLTPENKLYIIEGNANPELAMGDEFAESAMKGGLPFDRLLVRMLNLALSRE